MRSHTFDKLSFISLFLTVVLFPVFFLPFTKIPIETSKGLLLVIGLALSIVFWSLARFFDGKIVLPRSMPMLAGGGAIILAFLLSAIFSVNSQVSLFGTMFEVGSFWFIFAGFLLMLMSSIIFRDPKNARIVLLGTVLVSSVILLFQSARLFIPDILSLGVLFGKTANVLGSWNALGLFAGFYSVVMLLIIEFFPIARIVQWILQILMVLSMLFIAAVNFTFVWGLLGVASLMVFVYKVLVTYIKNKDKEEKIHFPTFSFTIIMVSLLFFMSSSFIGRVLPESLGVANNEFFMPFSSTTEVAKGVLAKDPILGLGPNRFDEAWASYKPAVINSTVFWDTSFNSGSGLIPTLVSTTGYLGIFVWIFFFILFLTAGVKSIFSSIKNGINWEMNAFFVLSLYLFISCFFYSTGPVIFLLALAFSGVFIGLLSGSTHNGEISISFLTDYRKSFFAILILILLMVASAALSFKYIERFASVSYFEKVQNASTIPSAETSIAKALSLYSNDLYLRTYAQIYLIKLNSIVAKGESLSDADKALLQSTFDQAKNSAILATQYDLKNYLNFEMLGLVYNRAGSLGVKDAYNQAFLAYQTASTLNPLNPRLKLVLATTSNALGKTEEAKNYAKEALTLKPDYADAFVVLSQIVKAEGNNAEALSYAEKALSIVPTDKNLIQYVDSLKNGSSSNNVPQDNPKQTNKP